MCKGYLTQVKLSQYEYIDLIYKTKSICIMYEKDEALKYLCIVDSVYYPQKAIIK